MADAQDSKSCEGDLVRVQVPPSAALEKPCKMGLLFVLWIFKDIDDMFFKSEKYQKSTKWEKCIHPYRT